MYFLTDLTDSNTLSFLVFMTLREPGWPWVCVPVWPCKAHGPWFTAAVISDFCPTNLAKTWVQSAAHARHYCFRNMLFLYELNWFLFTPVSLPAPKIVFNRLNGKKHHHPAPSVPADSQHEETFSPTHEENVKFVSEGKFLEYPRTKYLFSLFLCMQTVHAFLVLTLFLSEGVKISLLLPLQGYSHTAALTLIGTIGTEQRKTHSPMDRASHDLRQAFSKRAAGPFYFY